MNQKKKEQLIRELQKIEGMDINVREFCRKNKCSPSFFYKWQKQIIEKETINLQDKSHRNNRFPIEGSERVFKLIDELLWENPLLGSSRISKELKARHKINYSHTAVQNYLNLKNLGTKHERRIAFSDVFKKRLDEEKEQITRQNQITKDRIQSSLHPDILVTLILEEQLDRLSEALPDIIKSNIRINGFTPVTFAIKNGKMKIVMLFIEHGFDINERDDYGNTPLITAIEMNNPYFVETILSFHPNNMITNSKNQFPVDIAGENSNARIMKMLEDNITGRKTR